MKKVFISLLCTLSCAPSFAATMCMPDFSTCTTCTPVSYSGQTWSADCCGVRVSGIAFVLPIPETSYPKSIDFSDTVYYIPSAFQYYYYGCQMTAPIAAPYVYANAPGRYQCHTNNFFDKDLGEFCMNNFQISCAFTRCGYERGHACAYINSGGAD